MEFETRRQARQAALRELNLACEISDLGKIWAMFALPADARENQDWQLLTAEDARDCLIWMIDEDDKVVSRCLLELGPGLVNLHEKPLPILTKVKSHAMLQLLAEFGFDFKKYGHNILQLVSPFHTIPPRPVITNQNQQIPQPPLNPIVPPRPRRGSKPPHRSVSSLHPEKE